MKIAFRNTEENGPEALSIFKSEGLSLLLICFSIVNEILLRMLLMNSQNQSACSSVSKIAQVSSRYTDDKTYV